MLIQKIKFLTLAPSHISMKIQKKPCRNRLEVFFNLKRGAIFLIMLFLKLLHYSYMILKKVWQ